MDSADYTIKPGDDTLGAMPRHLRNCAAMYDTVTIDLTPKDALIVARTLERGLDPMPVTVVERYRFPSLFERLWASVALSLSAFAALDDIARDLAPSIAGWLQ